MFSAFNSHNERFHIFFLSVDVGIHVFVRVQVYVSVSMWCVTYYLVTRNLKWYKNKMRKLYCGIFFLTLSLSVFFYGQIEQKRIPKTNWKIDIERIIGIINITNANRQTDRHDDSTADEAIWIDEWTKKKLLGSSFIKFSKRIYYCKLSEQTHRQTDTHTVHHI